VQTASAVRKLELSLFIYLRSLTTTALRNTAVMAVKWPMASAMTQRANRLPMVLVLERPDTHVQAPLLAHVAASIIIAAAAKITVRMKSVYPASATVGYPRSTLHLLNGHITIQRQLLHHLHTRENLSQV
jgi:ABC-type Co2+ transport system permease subunit